MAPQPKPKAPDIADGELARVDYASRRAERTVFTAEEIWLFAAQLASIANERGYRVAHRYRQRFGVWPSANASEIEPVEPTAETRAWVRSQARAFAAAATRGCAMNGRRQKANGYRAKEVSGPPEGCRHGFGTPTIFCCHPPGAAAPPR